MPSHHSSSSHSSHSSHHSSHHSSSHSYHSSSSHSSSYHSSSSHSRSSHVSTPVYRQRTNQPTGYKGSSPKIYRCKSHDYSYYPDSWTDESTGTTYKAGYYDEAGNFYEDVVVTSGGVIPPGTNVLCECDYCRSKLLREWKEGEMSCPNCGGTVHVVSHMDDVLPETSYTSGNYGTNNGGKKKRNILIIILAVLMAPCFLGGLIEACEDDSDPGYQYESENYKEDSDADQFGDKMFLKKSGDGYEITTSEDYSSHADDPDYMRLVRDNDGNYYDKATEGYAYYNTDLSPAQFQYWFEGISSDYGDYGWMEYDQDQNKWYIEVASEDWQVLPDKYDTSRLWYIIMP